MGLEPTTSESAALGCIGFMNAALGFRLADFFATFLFADFLAAFFFFAIETSPVRGPNVDCWGGTKNCRREKLLIFSMNTIGKMGFFPRITLESRSERV